MISRLDITKEQLIYGTLKKQRRVSETNMKNLQFKLFRTLQQPAAVGKTALAYLVETAEAPN